MKDEYIIINKTELEKKLTKLKTKLSEENNSCLPLQRIIGEDSGKIRMIKEVISNSTPLIPVIENSWRNGHNTRNYFKGVSAQKYYKDYIENLKLEI